VVRAASAAWQAAQAAALTAQTLSEHPDLRAIFAENDEMALGAIAALRAAGRDDVVVVGFDGDARALRALHEGSLAATVAQSPRAISHAAFAAALQVARGARVAALELVPVRLIDRATMLETALDTLEIVPGLLGDVVRGAAEERRLQQQVIDAQQRMITMLSSPLVPISDDILVLPLIGPIDARRAQQIAETLLTGIVKQQAEWVIIDVTGVPLVDAQVAHYMLQAMRAVRLIGATPVLVGLGPQAAQMLIELAIDLSEVVVRGTLQRGLEYANAQRAAKRGIT
jgi:anti-anti-sigma regulatory factor